MRVHMCIYDYIYTQTHRHTETDIDTDRDSDSDSHTDTDTHLIFFWVQRQQGARRSALVLSYVCYDSFIFLP